MILPKHSEYYLILFFMKYQLISEISIKQISIKQISTKLVGRIAGTNEIIPPNNYNLN